MRHVKGQMVAVVLVAASLGTLKGGGPARPVDGTAPAGELGRRIGMMGVAWHEPPR